MLDLFVVLGVNSLMAILAYIKQKVVQIEIIKLKELIIY